jgi:hypothetical protein
MIPPLFKARITPITVAAALLEYKGNFDARHVWAFVTDCVNRFEKEATGTNSSIAAIADAEMVAVQRAAKVWRLVKREGLATGSLDVARQRIEYLVSSGEIVDAEELLAFLKLSRGELANGPCRSLRGKDRRQNLLVAPVRCARRWPYDAQQPDPSDRTPPFSEDAEVSVLAACLIDSHAIARRAASSRRHRSMPDHRRFFAAMCALNDSEDAHRSGDGEPVDQAGQTGEALAKDQGTSASWSTPSRPRRTCVPREDRRAIRGTAEPDRRADGRAELAWSSGSGS